MSPRERPGCVFPCITHVVWTYLIHVGKILWGAKECPGGPRSWGLLLLPFLGNPLPPGQLADLCTLEQSSAPFFLGNKPHSLQRHV